MKNKSLLISLCIVLALNMAAMKLQAQNALPIVSTEWLAVNFDTPNLVVLDMRNTEDYAAGHLPGSVNFPAFPNWYINEAMGEELPWMELPDKKDLFATIGNAGISSNSMVVIIARSADSPTEGPAFYSLTKAARVAITLIYAGIKNVSILNGGYDMWKAEGRAISTQAFGPKAISYDGKANDAIFVSKDYVARSIGNSIIIDTRDTDSYFGIEPDFTAKRAGHIPTAKSLPAPWFWQTKEDQSLETAFLMWKDPAEIKEIALAVVGEDLNKEIIDYCGVGGFASPVWFLLTQVVGYKDVKFYDGSMQEWTSDPDAPVVKYICE
jgi:thiosulfate/3-mercaptopyruvate sulfurtransferase